MATPQARAFRFNAGGSNYAVDIQASAVVLLVQRANGWIVAPEFVAIPATDAAILAEGGVMRYVDKLVAALNVALRNIFGKAVVDLAPAAGLQEQVLERLATHFKAHQLMDGSTEIQPK